MQIDWESSQEPADLEEAIEADQRLLSDLKELDNRPTITA